jgi:hypothetical protein
MSNTGKTIIITKVHPSTQLSGQGFLWNNPEGSYVGDITYEINDSNGNLTEIDKANYTLKNLFDYVTSAGDNKPSSQSLHNINRFFIADKTESEFVPKIYMVNSSDDEEDESFGGKHKHKSIKNKTSRRLSKSTNKCKK